MITEKCKVCGEPATYEKHGFVCDRHYAQLERHGKIVSVDRIARRIPKDAHCEHCDSRIFLQWYKGVLTCSKHRSQLVRHGRLLKRTKFDENDIVEMENHCKMFLYSKEEKKGYTLFDKRDLDLVKSYGWWLDKDNYVVTQIKGKRVLMHRLLLNYFGKADIDHKNGIKFDNRRANIRVCSRSQNLENRNSKGVSIDHRNKYKKFRAYITLNKKRIELGLFTTEEEALQVRQEAVKKHFGEFAFQPKFALADFRRLF